MSHKKDNNQSHDLSLNCSTTKCSEDENKHKHFDNFNDLLSSLDCRFKVIALSETRLVYNSLVPHNLSLKGYSLIHQVTGEAQVNCLVYPCPFLHENGQYSIEKLFSRFFNKADYLKR